MVHIFLPTVAFFYVACLVAVSDGFLVWDDCSSVTSEEDYIIETKGIWVTSVVHLDFAAAVGSFLTPFYTAVSGVEADSVEVADTWCNAVGRFVFTVFPKLGL